MQGLVPEVLGLALRPAALRALRHIPQLPVGENGLHLDFPPTVTKKLLSHDANSGVFTDFCHLYTSFLKIYDSQSDFDETGILKNSCQQYTQNSQEVKSSIQSGPFPAGRATAEDGI
jgi:hypothetical protein